MFTRNIFGLNQDKIKQGRLLQTLPVRINLDQTSRLAESARINVPVNPGAGVCCSSACTDRSPCAHKPIRYESQHPIVAERNFWLNRYNLVWARKVFIYGEIRRRGVGLPHHLRKQISWVKKEIVCFSGRSPDKIPGDSIAIIIKPVITWSHFPRPAQWPPINPVISTRVV